MFKICPKSTQKCWQLTHKYPKSVYVYVIAKFQLRTKSSGFALKILLQVPKPIGPLMPSCLNNLELCCTWRNIAAKKQLNRGILKNTRWQYTKEQNTLAKIAVIKQLQRDLLLDIKGQYMKEYYPCGQCGLPFSSEGKSCWTQKGSTPYDIQYSNKRHLTEHKSRVAKRIFFCPVSGFWTK